MTATLNNRPVLDTWNRGGRTHHAIRNTDAAAMNFTIGDQATERVTSGTCTSERTVTITAATHHPGTYGGFTAWVDVETTNEPFRGTAA